jgi:hypothetical protein
VTIKKYILYKMKRNNQAVTENQLFNESQLLLEIDKFNQQLVSLQKDIIAISINQDYCFEITLNYKLTDSSCLDLFHNLSIVYEISTHRNWGKLRLGIEYFEFPSEDETTIIKLNFKSLFENKLWLKCKYYTVILNTYQKIMNFCPIDKDKIYQIVVNV